MSARNLPVQIRQTKSLTNPNCWLLPVPGPQVLHHIPGLVANVCVVFHCPQVSNAIAMPCHSHSVLKLSILRRVIHTRVLESRIIVATALPFPFMPVCDLSKWFLALFQSPSMRVSRSVRSVRKRPSPLHLSGLDMLALPPHIAPWNSQFFEWSPQRVPNTQENPRSNEKSPYHVREVTSCYITLHHITSTIYILWNVGEEESVDVIDVFSCQCLLSCILVGFLVWLSCNARPGNPRPSEKVGPFILALMFRQLVIRWASLFLLGAVLSSNYFVIWPVWLDFNDVARACPIVFSVAWWLVFFNRLFPVMSSGSF